MPELEGMSEFVDRFFDKPLSHQPSVTRQAVEFLTQAIRRDGGARPTHLRLAEYVRENRDIKINLGHRQNSPVLRSQEALHALEDFRGMELLAFGMIGGCRIQPNRQYLAADRKPLR